MAKKFHRPPPPRTPSPSDTSWDAMSRALNRDRNDGKKLKKVWHGHGISELITVCGNRKFRLGIPTDKTEGVLNQRRDSYNLQPEMKSPHRMGHKPIRERITRHIKSDNNSNRKRFALKVCRDNGTIASECPVRA